jgi:hypothetical protein
MDPAVPPDDGDGAPDVPPFVVPPSLLASLAHARTLTESFRRLQLAEGARIADAMATLAEAFAPMRARLEEFQRTFDRLGLSAERMAAAWLAGLPENWRDLSHDDVYALIDRAKETGLCLVWLPRVEILREVLATDAAGTYDVLARHRDAVLDDAMNILSAVAAPGLQEERTGAEEAIQCLRAGYPRAAQALSASVFTSTLFVAFPSMKLADVRKRLADEDPMDSGMSQVRLHTIFVAGAPALADFDPAADGSISFNRHHTAHRMNAEQWTPRNALIGIMLVAGLLREFECWAVEDGEADDAQT